MSGEGIESEGVHGGELEQNVEHDRSDDEFLTAVAESSTGVMRPCHPISQVRAQATGTSGHRKRVSFADDELTQSLLAATGAQRLLWVSAFKSSCVLLSRRISEITRSPYFIVFLL